MKICLGGWISMNSSLKLAEEERECLNKTALSKLDQILRRYGNNVSEPHRQALAAIQCKFTDISSGIESCRYAFPLPPGAGKTCSVIAWLATLYEHGHSHTGVIVCTSKVEALCEIKRSLVKDHGVPEEIIGLIHSYKYDPKIAQESIQGVRELPHGYASEPATEKGEERQFLFLTHQRVKGACDIEKFNTYQGNARDLVIWDESLIASESFAIRDDLIESAIGQLRPLRLGKTPTRDKALDYLDECLGEVKKAIKSQREDLEGKPRLVKFPYLSGSQIEEFKASLGDDEAVQPLKSLLDISQEDLRVLLDIEQGGGGVITYNTLVPKELENIVILDASHIIRDLVRMDTSIKTSDIDTKIVSYGNVIVNQLWYHSGRHSLTKDFKQRKGQRLISREIADVIKTIPLEEGILLFHFKTRNRINFRSILKSDLEAAGIDTEAMIETRNGPKPRFAFCTWGSETSTSQFSYCSNVIFAGVLHRSHMDIGASMIGQMDNLLAGISNGQIREVITSEMVHSLYQGMCRGSCRVINGTETKSMKVWLIHKYNIRPLIERVMPGIRWSNWSSRYLDTMGKFKAAELATTIYNYIKTHLVGKTQISVSQLKKDTHLSHVPRRTFTRALALALEGTEWMQKGRSIFQSFWFLFGSQPELKAYF